MWMKRNKYGNKKVWYKGIKFDSGHERDYYIILEERLARGEISDLRLQVKYELTPSIKGEKEVVKHLKRGDKVVMKTYEELPASSYIADFVFIENKTGKEVVVDAKGYKTPEYQLKKKIMRYYKGITIMEV